MLKYKKTREETLFMDFMNVKQNCSVFGDGLHDDTKALQACLDELKNGGTIYFPDGIYLLSASLIFYSHQKLRFADNAVLLRSANTTPITRYLLASYSEPDWGGYSGTHDVIISGGIFDGNTETDEKSTLINTVHSSDIVIENCRFLHCSQWHFIELNATTKTVVRNCIFEGPSDTSINERLNNEQIQLDFAKEGNYGPIYNCDGTLIDFCKDETVCSHILIESNTFRCAGFPAIGHHGNCAHHHIEIRNNIFDGFSGLYGKSRGYIIFRPDVHTVHIADNTFIAPKKTESPNIGIILENSDKSTFTQENNVFMGHFDDCFVGNITAVNNVIKNEN